MKWTRSELLRQSNSIILDEDVEIDSSAFRGNSRITGVKDVHVSGTCWLDEEADEVYAQLDIDGIMICPDAITNAPIEVPFETSTDETYVFEPSDDDAVRVADNEVIELLPAVIDAILLEVPLQVTEAAEGEYPEGDGWKVYTEAEYQESRKDQIDPRLAILKQFKDE
ncbi:MAG: DUF177 domain-containing protein [Solobacterium sp.]|nr:DUF177 domain-containing protein [Solobacterium sp.]